MRHVALVSTSFTFGCCIALFACYLHASLIVWLFAFWAGYASHCVLLYCSGQFDSLMMIVSFLALLFCAGHLSVSLFFASLVIHLNVCVCRLSWGLSLLMSAFSFVQLVCGHDACRRRRFHMASRRVARSESRWWACLEYAQAVSLNHRFNLLGLLFIGICFLCLIIAIAFYVQGMAV